MKLSLACLLIALVSVGHLGSVADATVMRFFRVPWSWFGYGEEKQAPVQPTGAAAIEVAVQPVILTNEPELGAEPREVPESELAFDTTTTTTPRPTSLPPRPAAAIREIPFEISGAEQPDTGYYEVPATPENVDIGFEPDTSAPPPTSYSELSTDPVTVESFSPERVYPPNQPYIRPLAPLRRMGEIRSPSPKVESETTIEPDSSEVLFSPDIVAIVEEDDDDDDTNSTAVEEERPFDKNITIVEGDIIVDTVKTTEAPTTTEGKEVTTTSNSEESKIDIATGIIEVVETELDQDSGPKLEHEATTSAADAETEMEQSTTMASNVPTTSKLVELLKEASTTTVSDVEEEPIATTSPSPVFRPDVHLKNDTEDTQPRSLSPQAEQFLYNGDFAAELHRLYYSKPVFDKPTFEIEHAMKPPRLAGRSMN